MKFLLAAIIMITALIGCTDPTNARRVLEGDGYTDIEITGYSWFGCGKDDDLSTGFVAKKNGREVKGAVCSGFFFKNSTIRFE